MATTEVGRRAACTGAITAALLMFGAACSEDDDGTVMPPITGMSMAGALGSAGVSGAAGDAQPVAGFGGVSGTSSGAPSGPAPELPAITGDCPAFTDGSTIQVAGHGGVLIL